MRVESTTVKSILTRTAGYLDGIASHSLQPYRGCPLGASLCGAGCYVRHAGSPDQRASSGARSWRPGSTPTSRTGPRLFASGAGPGRSRGRFGIFLSSATEPFPPQEARLGITRSVLEAIRDDPPDALIVQTHSHRVADAAPLLLDLAGRCELRIHLSIETDRDRLPGLPGHGSPIDARFEAALALRSSGLFVVVTVAPLLPIADPDAFFGRIARSADAVVLDHFIGGDGSPAGSRTLRTPLPEAMSAVDPSSLSLDYRDRMASIADRHLPGRVGLGRDGFAGRWR